MYPCGRKVGMESTGRRTAPLAEAKGNGGNEAARVIKVIGPSTVGTASNMGSRAFVAVAGGRAGGASPDSVSRATNNQTTMAAPARKAGVGRTQRIQQRSSVEAPCLGSKSLDAAGGVRAFDHRQSIPRAVPGQLE